MALRVGKANWFARRAAEGPHDRGPRLATAATVRAVRLVNVVAALGKRGRGRLFVACAIW